MSVETEELAHAVGGAIEELHVAEVLCFGQFGEGDRPEGLSVCQFQEEVVHDGPAVVIVEYPFVPPGLRVVAKGRDGYLEENQQSSIPLIHDASNVDVAFHHLGMFRDEVRGEDAAHRVPAEDDFPCLQFGQQSQDQFRNMQVRAVVVPPAFVFPIEPWNGEVDPSATACHLGLQTGPLDMIPGRPMNCEDSVLAVQLVVSDIAVPSTAEVDSLFGPGLIVNLLFVGHFNFEG